MKSDSSDTCPICHGQTWIYYNGGRTTCDGCGGDGRNHYPPEPSRPPTWRCGLR